MLSMRDAWCVCAADVCWCMAMHAAGLWHMLRMDAGDGDMMRRGWGDEGG